LRSPVQSAIQTPTQTAWSEEVWAEHCESPPLRVPTDHRLRLTPLPQKTTFTQVQDID
jgi:hypothetical protein